MKSRNIHFTYLIFPIIFCFLTSMLVAQTTTQTKKGDGNFWEKISITAQIINVNEKNNEVTVKGPEGNEVTFAVDKNVDLSNVKKGDSIRADYYRSIIIEITKPTPEQERQKYTVLETQKITPAGIDLAGGSLRQVKAIVTIKKIDSTTQEVTISGPKGKEYTLTVPYKKMLDNLKEGQNAVITYTEAFATTFEKTK